MNSAKITKKTSMRNITRNEYKCSSPVIEKYILGAMVKCRGKLYSTNMNQKLDIKNFVLETDSPYLTPEPLRGKRNEPINITLVAKKIAELKNMEYEEVLNITTQTALKQFNINE